LTLCHVVGTEATDECSTTEYGEYVSVLATREASGPLTLSWIPRARIYLVLDGPEPVVASMAGIELMVKCCACGMDCLGTGMRSTVLTGFEHAVSETDPKGT
jgi:hypothetical protein